MEKNLEHKITELLEKVFEKLDLFKLKKEDLTLDYPSDERFGDLSTNVALRLSKSIKRPPREIALLIVQELQKLLKKNPLSYYLEGVRCEGAGFINFYLKNFYFYERIREIAEKGSSALRPDFGRKKSVLIEFVSANPTGPLSVAHARQAAVGDTLGNIIDFLGFRVKREYYLNDEGNQIEMLGESVSLRLRQLEGEEIEFGENHYRGEYVLEIAKKVRENKKTAGHLGEFAASIILETIKKDLVDFRVEFDYWSSQKRLRENGKIDKALKFLKKKGHLYEKEGALWFNSTALGDDKDRVVIKSDGSYTYLAPDIAYHQEKYKRKFLWLINLWGPDHHGYINRLKAAVSALGYPKDSLSIIIVQLASIFREGKSLEMSTRKGQYITLREVLDEVSVDAARFFFLMRKTNSHLDFDLDIAKKETSENPVYYVQYAHARIFSILLQAKKPAAGKADLTLLKEKEELLLIKKVLQFPYILNICRITLDPYMLTVYLQQLAEQFHKFYDSHRVLGNSEALTAARLLLIGTVKTTIAEGLKLLGVSRPEKM